WACNQISWRSTFYQAKARGWTDAACENGLVFFKSLEAQGLITGESHFHRWHLSCQQVPDLPRSIRDIGWWESWHSKATYKPYICAIVLVRVAIQFVRLPSRSITQA
ncbi:MULTISPECIES: hypothetical protein, partial [unclassified Arthrobacter]|uniref:hypothetical protein n=1 Tax=unclassified Arthrobacter TaxID=235627 RepID=UPI001C6118FE